MPKRAFIVGIGDDQGYAWAIAHALAESGVHIYLGIYPPVYPLFLRAWKGGKFDEARTLSNGNVWEFQQVYPLDVRYDTMASVPEEVRTHKRFAHVSNYTITDVVRALKDLPIDYLVHAVGFSPEIQNPLLETSRSGYLETLSASSYSFIALAQHFAPLMPSSSALLNLSFQASSQVIPGYGGGMSAAKAALESDTRTLAYEMGRQYGIRVNSISAGPLRSKSARAIGDIDRMIEYTQDQSPLQKPLYAYEVGAVARFLLSPEASAITGAVIPVDNGFSIMGTATINAPTALQPVAEPQ